jgi:hypothetical protein
MKYRFRRNEQTREKRKLGRVVRETIFDGRGEDTDIFSPMKVPRHCPLVLLIKVG